MSLCSDKKSATKYQLFHRSQNDPLIHDSEAEDRVLHQVSGPIDKSCSSSSAKPSQNLADLERDFYNVRKNEGEAANYGIYFDDTEYDYMQHLRELGQGGGRFVEAAPAGKGKGKSNNIKLEDALRQTSLNDRDDGKDGVSVAGSGSIYSDDFNSMASSYSRKPTYQDQQDVPDAIAGFQPDMDPRLREALEALEDDAFADTDSGEDLFETLVEGGQEAEMDPSDWRDTHIEDDDDGWESDATEKAPEQPDIMPINNGEGEEVSNDSNTDGNVTTKLPPNDEEIPDVDTSDGDWMREFAKFKKDTRKAKENLPSEADNASALRSATSTAFTAGGTPVRKKKRKGALTNPSSYSMTSSSLARTDGLRLLDDRFEKVEALYSLDEEGEDEFDGASSFADDNMSVASGMSKVSEAPSLVSENGGTALRTDFNSIMDGFLDGWDDRGTKATRKGAKGKRGKNGNEALGMRMLDEVRQGLGPARLHGKS